MTNFEDTKKTYSVMILAAPDLCDPYFKWVNTFDREKEAYEFVQQAKLAADEYEKEHGDLSGEYEFSDGYGERYIRFYEVADLHIIINYKPLP